MSKNDQMSSTVSGLDAIEKMFSNYEEKKASHAKSNGGKRNDFSKYFTPRNDTETFRMIPNIDGRDLVEEAYFHTLDVNTPSGNKQKGKKIYCLAKNNPKVPKLDKDGNQILDEQGKPVMVKQRCPACERAEQIRNKIPEDIRYKKNSELDEETKEKRSKINSAANGMEAKLFYIIRGIDRGASKDGVKFWRFKDSSYKKQGVYDKLLPAIKLYVQEEKASPADPENGCDFHIVVVESSLNNGKTYKDVAAITAKKPSRLHEDDILMNEWLKDRTTWRDVFKPATPAKLTATEYLERVIKGTDPYWDDRDDKNKKYFFPDPNDAELERIANTKTESLDVSDDDEEMASDLVNGAVDVITNTHQPSIENVTKEDVGEFKDDSMDISKEFENEKVEPKTEPKTESSFDSDEDENEDYDDVDFDTDDLPF